MKVKKECALEKYISAKCKKHSSRKKIQLLIKVIRKIYSKQLLLDDDLWPKILQCKHWCGGPYWGPGRFPVGPTYKMNFPISVSE